MKTIYLMRHSESEKLNYLESSETLQLQNEKSILSKKGEQLAKEKSQIEELSDFDIVISSSYVRAIATAKYFTKDKINIIESFGERKFGFNTWDEKPENFEEKQFADFNYKYKDGESLNEVKEREEIALYKILNEYPNKKVLIIGHATAFAVLFSKWCDINWGDYKFNNINFFDGKFNFCETFKLEFDDDNNLINIINIR